MYRLNSTNLFQQPEIAAFIQQSLQEDIGSGDHSSLAAIPAGANGRAKLLIKEDGIVAGIELALLIFKLADPTLIIEVFKKDGDLVKRGDEALHVFGSIHSILKTERLVLNLMQRLSGIATTTARIVKKTEGTGVRILDTRKTTPGLRMLEKWAVTVGGGYNHRFGLFDMVMLKDNHIDYAGGIVPAIQNTLSYLEKNKLNLKIEVETRNLDEVKTVMDTGGIHRIMLDNFSPAIIKEAVKLIGGRYETEASGGITELNVKEYAETGVDFISIGALTHSVKSMDISLKEF